MVDKSLEKPGVRALQAMQSLTNAVSIFKVPKAPEKKKRKMKILTEDHYIEVCEFVLFLLMLFKSFINVRVLFFK